ncbi:MAG: redoxin domain-containing protein [Planctomycetota bacterium]|nr:redoxin domain-containing protein [Planctomycetota bacterium]
MHQPPRRPLLAALLACGLFLATAPWAGADDDKAPKAELDKKAPPIVMQDTAGRSFELHDASIGKKDAEAVVLASAIKMGAKSPTLTTKIADMKGMKDEDGELDASKVQALAIAAGEYFGLIATEESAAKFNTLGDLVTWINSANDAPILLFTWGPRCPTSRNLNDRIVEIVANGNVRAYALACNYKDTEEHYARFMSAQEFNFRIFPDRDQRVTDILGGKTTPHFFLFDSKGVLRYRGGLDNDPMGYMEDDERQDWLSDAVDAIKGGKEVAAKDTKPAG